MKLVFYKCKKKKRNQWFFLDLRNEDEGMGAWSLVLVSDMRTLARVTRPACGRRGTPRQPCAGVWACPPRHPPRHVLRDITLKTGQRHRLYVFSR